MPYVWSKNRKLGVLGSVYSEILRGDDGVSQRAKNWRATMRVPRIPTPENTILPSLTVSLDSSALISWNRSLRSDSCLASISLRRDSCLASMSLRKSPISRRKSSLVARKSSFVANSFRLTSKTSDKTSASDSAWADGTPPALPPLAPLSVSKAGSAINQFSFASTLAQLSSHQIYPFVPESQGLYFIRPSITQEICFKGRHGKRPDSVRAIALQALQFSVQFFQFQARRACVKGSIFRPRNGMCIRFPGCGNQMIQHTGRSYAQTRYSRKDWMVSKYPYQGCAATKIAYNTQQPIQALIKAFIQFIKTPAISHVQVGFIVCPWVVHSHFPLMLSLDFEGLAMAAQLAAVLDYDTAVLARLCRSILDVHFSWFWRLPREDRIEFGYSLLILTKGSRFFYIRPLTSSDEAAYIALNAEPSAGGFASPCTTGAEEPRRIYFKRKRLFCVKCLALLLWRAG